MSTDLLIAELERVGEWQLFAIDGVWMALDSDQVTGVYRLDEDELARTPDTGRWRQPEFNGDLWHCDESLWPTEGEMRDWAVWLESEGRPIGLMVDRTELVRSGPLVSIYGLPPILDQISPLMQALLLPDKSRVATVLDAHQLAQLALSQWRQPEKTHG